MAKFGELDKVSLAYAPNPLTTLAAFIKALGLQLS